MATPDIDVLYEVLRAWAVAKPGRPGTYAELSRQYEASTGERFEPHGSWDRPLGDLNVRLAAAGAPALSSLVVLQETGQPGGGFWGCAANVPARPAREHDRDAAWVGIVRDVFAYDWPPALP
jgi:hypothetical protein